MYKYVMFGLIVAVHLWAVAWFGWQGVYGLLAAWFYLYMVRLWLRAR